MNDALKEQITYEKVQEGIDEIKKCADTMEEIFNKVTSEVRKMTNDDVYKGESRDTYVSVFEEFKGNFPNYVAKVREFADAYTEAAQIIRQTELAQAKKAEQL